jgi:hypothetical protein
MWRVNMREGMRQGGWAVGLPNVSKCGAKTKTNEAYLITGCMRRVIDCHAQSLVALALQQATVAVGWDGRVMSRRVPALCTAAG